MMRIFWHNLVSEQWEYEAEKKTNRSSGFQVVLVQRY